MKQINPEMFFRWYCSNRLRHAWYMRPWWWTYYRLAPILVYPFLGRLMRRYQANSVMELFGYYPPVDYDEVVPLRNLWM